MKRKNKYWNQLISYVIPAAMLLMLILMTTVYENLSEEGHVLQVEIDDTIEILLEAP